MAVKTVAVNRKAYHDYHILDSLEAGMVLTGPEIKSIRAGTVNLRDSYAVIEGGEVWLRNAHIARYEAANRYNPDPTRPRKLLLHKKEIRELAKQVGEKGSTLVPLKLYLKDDVAKVELGLARGKKLYDKREAIARRDAEREARRRLGRRR